MKLSVFTPTHDPKHLSETYDSLLTQGYTDFEWVIVPNGEALTATLPAEILADPRVRVVPFVPAQMTAAEAPVRIGALKRFACENCTGDVFVELDHDDLLTPSCLAQIARCVREGAGFVYSDVAYFRRDGEGTVTRQFGEKHGWEHYPFRVYEWELAAIRSFPVTARALCDIHYSPDHVRAWTREAYTEAGGHNAELTAGDDHDLMVRTYLKGVEFKHTGSVGYLYRLHDKQSYIVHNELIQQQSATTARLNLAKLVREWCRRTGYEVIEIAPRDTLAQVLDLLRARGPDTAGLIHCRDWLQRHAYEDVLRVMQHVYRVLVPGGWFTSVTPSTTGMGAFTPLAKSYWNRHTLRYFCEAFYRDDLSEAPWAFQAVHCYEDFPGDNYRNAQLTHLYAHLCALKGQRQPGEVYCQPPNR